MDNVISWIALFICSIIGIICVIRKGLKEIDNNSGDDGVTRHRVRRE